MVNLAYIRFWQEKKTEPEDSESLDAAFKEAVDSYEAFIDEYVSFMDK